ncbi:MAG: cyclic pyranopterin monophosphate synthase MoaC [Candidatus Omnitrophota bacterium]
MIDVGEKGKTVRIAKAAAIVELDQKIIERIKNKTIPKGDVLEISRVAGILAAKRTYEIIPLCHNIEIDYVDLCFTLESKTVSIKSIAKATAKTGVEMEAMVACSVAALTVYDMCKMFSKSIKISNVELIEKQGGKSGDYRKR